MFNWFKKLKRKFREEEILSDGGSICWCPSCKCILGDEAKSIKCNNCIVEFTCSCGDISEWDFNPPVPIFLRVVVKDNK